MTPDKVEAALGDAISAIRGAVDGLQYRGKAVNATDEDNLRDEVYAEIDPYVTELEVEFATLTEALASAERDAARYRWLRDDAFLPEARHAVQLLPGAMDAAIDAAMKETP